MLLAYIWSNRAVKKLRWIISHQIDFVRRQFYCTDVQRQHFWNLLVDDAFQRRNDNDAGSRTRSWQFLSGEREHGKKSCFCQRLLAKRPSHLSHEVTRLQLFLAQVWEQFHDLNEEYLGAITLLRELSLPLSSTKRRIVWAVPWEITENFDWRISLLIQWEWPVMARY